MSRPSFFSTAPLATLIVLLMVLGCSELSSASSGGFGEGGFGFGGNAGTGGITSPPVGGGVPGSFDYSALCGIDVCTPSSLEPLCDVGPTGNGGASTGTGTGGGSAGGAAPGGGEPGGGEPGGAGQGGSGGGAALTYGCQITNAGGQTPLSVCAPAGSTSVAGVCNSSADCSPGLGCVLSSETNEGGGAPTPSVGLCRPYCCGLLEDCPPDTFCAPQPLFDAAARLDDPTLALPIPVCAPIIDCQLLGDSCGEGQTCTIVRADGSTSCVPLGSGRLCQACPCAEGFVCSFSSGTCQQLCDTNANDCPGADAHCQGGGPLPDNLGLCVLGEAACE